jgi:acyl dehydratase
MTTIVDDAVRAWIGREYPARRIHVGRTDVERFAIATGDDDPLCQDLVAARAAGYPDLVAPLGFVAALAAHSQLLVPREQLRPDGLVEEQYPPLPLRRVVVGEVDLRFHRRVIAGETITVRKRLADIRERLARDGTTMVVLDFERRYEDEAGEAVAEERYAVIVR